MPDLYPPQCREMDLAQVRAGWSVREVVEGPEVSTTTVFRWKTQDKIDRDEPAGLTTTESSELRAARPRNAELEGSFTRRHKPPSDHAIRRAWLTDVIVQIWQQSRRTYEWRRVQTELADAYDHVANKEAGPSNHS
jgi:hypothetical protein